MVVLCADENPALPAGRKKSKKEKEMQKITFFKKQREVF
jgi:hypothetical protein